VVVRASQLVAVKLSYQFAANTVIAHRLTIMRNITIPDFISCFNDFTTLVLVLLYINKKVKK